MTKVPDYFNRVNVDLLGLIPPDAKIVLEIGCGAGALCEAYRRMNPAVRWFAYELNADAAIAAAKHCDEVFTEDVEEGYVDSLEIQKTDCIIFGDVLEHLHDPWNVLKRLTSTAKENTQVLACIPNVQHWTVIRDLLRGKWTYTDEGLLDRTHLRFFTMDSIKDLFQQSGLYVFEMRGRDINNGGYPDWLKEVGLAKSKEMQAFQYVVRAIKPTVGSPAKLMKWDSPSMQIAVNKIHIHAVTAEQCCARPRIWEPFAMLNTIPGVKCTHGEEWNHTFHPDILIQQRFRSLNIERQKWAAERMLLIAELDDDPDGLEGYQESDYIQLRAVHAVQVSTERLADTVKRYNPNVLVVENQIADLAPYTKRPISTNEVKLFYGAQNRKDDWAPIMPELNKVLHEYPDITVDVIHDKEFYDALKTANKTFEPFCEYGNYRAILRGTDIALLPLRPGRFNSHKSDIKFLECASEGVAVLANGEVYHATFDKWDELSGRCTRTCGYNYNDVPSLFRRQLISLITSHRLREECTTNAYEYVQKHRMLSQHFREPLLRYRGLLSSKPELDRQLMQRAPELAQHAPASSAASLV